MKKIKIIFLYIFVFLVVGELVYMYREGGNLKSIISLSDFSNHKDVDFILISGHDTVFCGYLDTIQSFYVFIPPETKFGFHELKIISKKLEISVVKKYFILPVTNVVIDISHNDFIVWYTLLPPRLM